LTVGQTFSFDELTVAAFKNEKLVGFILITPLDKPEANLVTYDATGKQLNTLPHPNACSNCCAPVITRFLRGLITNALSAPVSNFVVILKGQQFHKNVIY